MTPVPYAYLTVTLVGAVMVALAYRPIRREPFTVVSFTGAWIAGELAFQNIVWQVVATVAFVELGALDGWAGWLGLAVAVLNWVGLFGLGVADPGHSVQVSCGAGHARRRLLGRPRATPPPRHLSVAPGSTREGARHGVRPRWRVGHRGEA